MAWTGLTLTVAGRNALNQAQLSNKMNFKCIVVGDGMPPANYSTLQGLVHQLYELEDLKIEVTDSRCILTADFPRVDYDYYFREIGVIVVTDEGEKLYVYDNCGDDAQYMVSTTGAETTQKRIRLSLNISDVAEITVADPGILYVDYSHFEQTTVALDAGIKKNAKGLEDHLEDTVKHITSAERTEWNDKQTKIGDAKDNVVTLDTPSARSLFSTGEKLSAILGKIRKTLMDLKAVAFSGSYNDLSDKPIIPMPVAVKGNAENTYRTGNVNLTPANIGLGNVNNTSDANKPVSTAQQNAIDATYANSNAYTDDKIAKLINGAPSTLDTLGEIAKAMQDNDNVVDALDEAIGTKASAAEFDTHVKDAVKHITTAEREKWNNALPKTGNAASATKLLTAHTINGISFDGTADRAGYGICDVSPSIADKTVECNGFVVSYGSEITVKFTSQDVGSKPALPLTLIVNGTGGAIYYHGNDASSYWNYFCGNRTYKLHYNGLHWDIIGDFNTDTNNAVTQTNTTTNANYRVLMSATADNTTRTEGVRKDADFYYNPGTNTLTAGNITANTQDSTISFTCADNVNPTAWTDVSVLVTGEKHSSLLNKLSTMVKNVRYLYKMLGSTDISSLGDGTVTGALSSLNTGIITRPGNIINVAHNVVLCATGVGILVGSFPLPFYVDANSYDVSILSCLLANKGTISPSLEKSNNSIAISYNSGTYTQYQAQALYLRLQITFK